MNSRSGQKIVKSKFTPEEDQKLFNLVNGLQEVDWNAIAKQFSHRNSRQCRERWQNYLNPNLTKDNWTEDDDRLLLDRYKEMGPHWNAIGRTLGNRSGNSVRNRYLVLMRFQQKHPESSLFTRASSPVEMPTIESVDSPLGNMSEPETPKDAEVSLIDKIFNENVIEGLFRADEFDFLETMFM